MKKVFNGNYCVSDLFNDWYWWRWRVYCLFDYWRKYCCDDVWVVMVLILLTILMTCRWLWWLWYSVVNCSLAGWWWKLLLTTVVTDQASEADDDWCTMKIAITDSITVLLIPFPDIWWYDEEWCCVVTVTDEGWHYWCRFACLVQFCYSSPQAGSRMVCYGSDFGSVVATHSRDSAHFAVPTRCRRLGGACAIHRWPVVVGPLMPYCYAVFWWLLFSGRKCWREYCSVVYWEPVLLLFYIVFRFIILRFSFWFCLVDCWLFYVRFVGWWPWYFIVVVDPLLLWYVLWLLLFCSVVWWPIQWPLWYEVFWPDPFLDDDCHWFIVSDWRRWPENLILLSEEFILQWRYSVFLMEYDVWVGYLVVVGDIVDIILWLLLFIILYSGILFIGII